MKCTFCSGQMQSRLECSITCVNLRGASISSDNSSPSEYVKAWGISASFLRCSSLTFLISVPDTQLQNQWATSWVVFCLHRRSWYLVYLLPTLAHATLVYPVVLPDPRLLIPLSISAALPVTSGIALCSRSSYSILASLGQCKTLLTKLSTMATIPTVCHHLYFFECVKLLCWLRFVLFSHSVIPVATLSF